MLIIRIFILAILMQSAFGVHSQKIRDKRIDVNYVSLPEQTLPDSFNTYSVDVSGSSLRDVRLIEWDIERHIRMDGFTKLEGGEKGDADLRIHVDAGTLFEGLALMRSRAVTQKQRGGGTVVFRYYWYEVDYSITPSFEILDPKNKRLASGTLPVHETLRTREYTDPGRLQRSYSYLVRDLREKFVKGTSEDIARATQRTIAEQFDFAFVTDQPQMYYVKNHPEEQAFEKHVDRTELIFKEMTATTPAEEGLNDLSREIAFWQKYVDRGPGREGPSREVWAASNYNLAVVFYYLDRIDEAENHLQQILKLDSKDKRASALLEQIRRTKELMDLHGIRTMHYDRNNE
jgi:hypothetical protein